MTRPTPTRFPGFQAGAPTLRQRLFGHAPTPRQAWWWAAAALSAGAAGALHTQAQGLQAAQQALAAARQRPAAAAAPRAQLSPAQAARWRLALAQLNADWRGWFDALERRTPPEVALRSIEPDAARRQWRLQAEAAGLDPLMAWARALGAEPAFAAVRPLQHQTQAGPQGETVRLTLVIDLAGASAAPEQEAEAAPAATPGGAAP